MNKILIFDKSENLLSIMKKILKKDGYIIKTLGNYIRVGTGKLLIVTKQLGIKII